MPRYDYRCQKCGHGFELKQSFDSEPIAECPNCAGESRRVIYSVPVMFKGPGFYVNDYGRGNGAKPSSSESEKAKADGGSDKAEKSQAKAESGSKTESGKENASTGKKG